MSETQYNKEVDLLRQYEEIKPLLQKWGDFLDKNIISIIAREGFNLSRIQISPCFRIKNGDSLIGKAFYRGGDITKSSDPLSRIYDKVGTRIVVTTIDDVKMIRDIIMGCKDNLWTARESRSLDKQRETNPKEFDYQSLHINLTPTSNIDFFHGLSKSKRELYTCELQVRTLLQHAFAEVAHDTIYKGAFGSDNDLVRTLSRLMALIEVSDEYIISAYEIMNKEDTYEKSFLKELINIAHKELDLEFKERDINRELTKELFLIYDVRGEDINDVKRIIIANKDIIKKAINKLETYLSKQPVLIFLIYLIYTVPFDVERKWFLESLILDELYYYLGLSRGLG